MSRCGFGYQNQLFRFRTDVMSEGSYWSSIRPPSQLHGCRRTASPAPPPLVGVSGEHNLTSRETPEGSLMSSRSIAIEVPWKAVRRPALVEKTPLTPVLSNDGLPSSEFEAGFQPRSGHLRLIWDDLHRLDGAPVCVLVVNTNRFSPVHDDSNQSS